MGRRIKQRKWRSVLSDEERKPIGTILRESLICTIRERELPAHYFACLLYKKGRNDYLDYIGRKKYLFFRDSEIANDFSLRPFLGNKLLFHEYMKGFSVKLPNLLAFNLMNNLISNDGCFRIDNYESFANGIIDISKKCSGKGIFVKPIDGRKGASCFLLNTESVLDEGSGANAAYEAVARGAFLFEEGIVQHKQIDAIYSRSVNSIRIDTYYNEDNEVEIIAARMRFGAGGSVMDNTSQGGCSVKIDLNSGKLCKEARLGVEYGGRVCLEHPDSGFRFEGFEVPYFDEVKEVVTKAAKCIPDMLIGWDVAIAEDGPVLIEGNADYNISRQQLVCGGYRSNPVFQKVLKRFGF